MEINSFALPSFEHCTRTRRMRTSTRNWWATVLEKDVGTKMWSFQVRGYLDFDVEMENVGVFWSGTEALLLEYRWQTWDTFVSSLLWLFLNPAKNSSGWGRSRRCWRTTGSGSSSSGRRSRAAWWRNLKLGEEGESPSATICQIWLLIIREALATLGESLHQLLTGLEEVISRQNQIS